MEQKNILVVVLSFSGHFNPAFSIAQGLVERGHKVTLMSNNFNSEKWVHLAQENGMEAVNIKDDYEIDINKFDFKFDDGIPINFINNKLYPFILKAFEGLKTKPDLILGDIATTSATMLARKYNIPLVVNSPLLYDEGTFFFGMATPHRGISIGGIQIYHQSMVSDLVAKFFAPGIREWKRRIMDARDHGAIFLIDSFIGLDKPCLIPPFVKLVGSVHQNRKLDLQKKDSSLNDWIQSKKNRDIVYISMGSALTLNERQIELIYEGLKKIENIVVIWSFRLMDKFPEHIKQDPDFYVRDWIPQYEVLQQPQVKAFISHCGFGGTLEAIMSETPLLCLGLLNDGVTNSLIIGESKAGIVLHTVPFSISGDYIKVQRYFEQNPRFTSQDITQKVSKLINDPSYKQNMQKLKKLSLASGGRDEAVRIIEQTILTGGGRHLYNERLEEISRKNSLSTFGYLILGGLILGGYKIYKKFYQK